MEVWLLNLMSAIISKQRKGTNLNIEQLCHFYFVEHLAARAV